MKPCLLLICFTLIFPGTSSSAVDPTILRAKPQNGVFFTYTGYMTTVLELKDGNFRYWFESDAKMPQEPEYPLTGEYETRNNSIFLMNDKASQRKWTFQSVNGIVTLWRADAIVSNETDKNLDLKRLNSFGLGSTLVFSEKRPEELWQHRGPPSK